MTTSTNIGFFICLAILFAILAWAIYDRYRLKKKLTSPRKKSLQVPKFKTPPPPPRPERPEEWEPGKRTHFIRITPVDGDNYYEVEISKEEAEKIENDLAENTFKVTGLIKIKNSWAPIKEQVTLIFPIKYLMDCGIEITETIFPKRCGDEEE